MKWIGQHIWDRISRFRNAVYFENVENGDSDTDKFLIIGASGKLKYRTGAEVLSDIGASSSSGISHDGSTADGVLTYKDADEATVEQYLTFANNTNISTLSLLSNQDTANKFTMATTTSGATTLTTVDSEGSNAHFEIDSDGRITLNSAGQIALEPGSDVTIYDATNDGSPTVSLGSSANDRFEIKSVYNSGAQTIDSVDFTTYTTSSTSNDGRYRFFVDEVELVRILDGSMFVNGSFNAKGDGAYLQTKSETTSSATEGGKLRLICDDGAAMGDDHRLGVIQFEGAEDASNNFTIGAQIEAFCDAAWSASENGARMVFSTTDGNANTSEVLRLDSDKIAAFAGSLSISGSTLTFDSVGLTAIQTSGESFTDNDTSLMTSAAVDDRINTAHATVQTGKNYRIINTSFRDDIGTTKHYLPLKSQDEQTALTREEGTELAVCDGRLVSATIRVENMQTTIGAFNLTVGVETNVINTAYASFSVIETEVLEVTDTNDDHHVFHFVFDTAKHWDSTDMFAISIQSSGDAWASNERFFVTLVIEDDWSTYLAGVSREIEATP
jgi:hypothetical protein